MAMHFSVSERVRFSAISLIIIGVLAAQTFSGFRKTQRWWPFLAYPMYAEAHFEGERIAVNHRIYAVTSDGVRHYLHPENDLKLYFWRHEGLARGAVQDDFEHNPLPGLVKDLYPTVERIEIEDYPMVITRDGPAPAPTKIVKTIPRATIDRWSK